MKDAMTRPYQLRGRSFTALLLTLTLAAPLAAQRPIPGLDRAGMDTTVRPGDDFYRFANGGWERQTVIPADRSSYGSFNIAAEAANRRLTELVTGAAATPAPAFFNDPETTEFYTSWV